MKGIETYTMLELEKISDIEFNRICNYNGITLCNDELYNYVKLRLLKIKRHG